MSTWKYTDSTNTVVSTGNESCLVSVIADWIAEGNTPLPADAPDQNIPHLAVLAAADAPFTPRRMREFMRAVLEDKAQAMATANNLTLEQVEAMNPAYQFVKQADDAAIAARAQLVPFQS